MATLTYNRVQTVEVKLKRQPTEDEIKILLWNGNENMFSLPLDLIDFDEEVVINEDYSFNCYPYIPKPTLT